MRKHIFPLTLIAGMLATPVAADEVSDNLEVSATVEATCLIQSGASISFGNVTTLLNKAGNIDKSTADSGAPLTVLCTKQTEYEVNASLGQHGVGNDRRMQSSEDSESFITYALYREDSRTNDIGPGHVFHNGVGTGEPQEIHIYGRIPAGLTSLPAPGSYTDTVTLGVFID